MIGAVPSAVRDRLRNIARSVDNADRDEAATQARREIPLLVDALQSVLAEHRPDSRGHCRLCGKPRNPLGRLGIGARGKRGPCRAYLTAMRALGAEPSDGSALLRDAQ